MAYTITTAAAGPLVIKRLHPRMNGHETEAVRRGKQRVTSECQRRKNLKTARTKCKLLIAANFGPGDLFVTLTYRPGVREPERRPDVLDDCKAFVRRLAAMRREDGLPELRYIYTAERGHTGGHWHLHFVLNATGADADMIRRCWRQGDSIEIKPIQIDLEHGYYDDLASYITKEDTREHVGQRLWSGSLNLKKPDISSERAGEDAFLDVPEAATIIDKDSGGTVYGRWAVVEYLEYMPTKSRAKR